jgi:hypothetical protein
MTADFDANLLTPGMHKVSVADSNQTPSQSKELLFSVYGPTPILVGLSPGSLPSGGSSFTLAVTGRNFICNGGISDSVVYFGLTRHKRESCGPSPTSGGDMQMTVIIAGSEIANAGAVTVTVVNPPPGGGTSLRTSFTVTAQ